MDFNNDRFSNLPKELVILIISYLPLLDAFRFCLLRKEWLRFQLWKHCNSIELHETTFTDVATRQHQLNVGRRVRALELKATGKLKFVDFFNRTVPRIISPVLSRFSFQMAYATKYHDNIDQWLEIALSKNTEELSLDFSDGDPLEVMPAFYTPLYVLPEFFYENGKSVRVLSLNSCCLGFCNFQNFVWLKSLTLTRVGMFMVEMENVLSRCPVLESLVIVECYQLIKIEICLTLSRLERLVVRYCDSLSLGIELCLPRLKYFEYGGGLIRFNMNQLNEVEEVVLDFQIDAPYPYLSEEIREFLSGFSQAKIFTVSTSALKVFPYQYLSGQPLLQLINVEHLTLKTCMERYELSAILCLLRSSPSLKTLSISSGFMRPLNDFTQYGYPELPDGFWMPEQWTLAHLERVSVDRFTGKKYEVDLLKFLLKNSRMLRKLVITPRIGGKPSLYSQAFADLKNAETASKHVIIKCR